MLTGEERVGAPHAGPTETSSTYNSSAFGDAERLKKSMLGLSAVSPTSVSSPSAFGANRNFPQQHQQLVGNQLPDGSNHQISHGSENDMLAGLSLQPVTSISNFQPLDIPPSEYFATDFSNGQNNPSLSGPAGQQAPKPLLVKTDFQDEASSNENSSRNHLFGGDHRWLLPSGGRTGPGEDMGLKQMQEKYARFPLQQQHHATTAKLPTNVGMETLATAAQVASGIPDSSNPYYSSTRMPAIPASTANTLSTTSFTPQLSSLSLLQQHEEPDADSITPPLSDHYSTQIQMGQNGIAPSENWHYDVNGMPQPVAFGLPGYDFQQLKKMKTMYGNPNQQPALFPFGDDLLRTSQFQQNAHLDVNGQGFSYGSTPQQRALRLSGDNSLHSRYSSGLELPMSGDFNGALVLPPASRNFTPSGFAMMANAARTILTDPQRTHKCTHPGCNKTFKRRSHLQAHVRLHSSEKNFKCSYAGCTQAFSRKDYLDKHERTHTGVRPFACTHQDCGKAFSQANDLKRHFRVHSGVKPYKCNFPGCNKAFSQSGHLRRHIATHEKKYSKGLGF